MDKDKKGYVSLNDIRRSFEERGEKISEQELHAILSELDTNMNGQVELDEYLEVNFTNIFKYLFSFLRRYAFFIFLEVSATPCLLIESG